MTIIRDGLLSADLEFPVTAPTLNLDFANSQSLDPRITFTRGSIGTRVNKNGIIETISANQPRFDYDPISGECKGLLIEESRSNLITNSNNFGSGNAFYGITPNVVISPDGTLNASKFFEGPINNFHVYFNSFTAVAGRTYCASVFLKAAESTNAYFKFSGGGAGSNEFYVNLKNGTITSGTNRGIINYGNGWYRVYSVLTFITSVAGNAFQLFTTSPSGALTYQGNGSSGYYVYGMQVEEGAFPTSYIPTSASTVTRSADNASMTGTNFSSWFGSSSPSELSVFYSGLAPYAPLSGAYYWVLFNSLNTERIQLRYAGQPQVVIVLNGINYSGAFANSSQNINIKSMGLIDNKSVSIRLNDGPPSLSFANITIPRIPTEFSQLNIGSSASSFNYLNGTIRKLSFYPKKLLSSQAVYMVA
jgi:hypothetical protein